MATSAIVEEMMKKIKAQRQQTKRGDDPTADLRLDGPKDSAAAYWDPNNKCYWMKNYEGDWQKEGETHVNRYLQERVFSDVDDTKMLRRMCNNYLLEVHHKLSVHYAGPLAGYKRGIHRVCGNKVLVTREAEPIRPRAGEWKQLRTLIEELLRDQACYFYGWLQSSMRALRAGPPFRPGQALAMCGPGGTGKSLLQNLITEIFGGRFCKPYKFMRGKTDFNSEHLGTEHLMIEDDAAATDLRSRREIGAAIKAFVANETHAMYPKGKEPMMMTPFWRCTITLNDEPENLMVLPPLDESLKDKITILKAHKTKIVYDSDSDEARQRWRVRMTNDLPGLLSFVASWRVPAEVKDVRYGVRSYQHPDVLEALSKLSPEDHLLVLIDAIDIWDLHKHPWEGTAAKLEQQLLEADKLGRVIRLLSYNTACGCYLARLAARPNSRVKVTTRASGKAFWMIDPPADDDDA